MAVSRLWHLGAILGLAMALAVTAALHSEDDFAFEATVPEEQGDPSEPISHMHPHPTSAPVQRLWGIPDTVAPVGKLFHMTIPGDAFSGDVDRYEARGPGGARIPSWMLFDKATGLFEGVPSAQDLGEHYVTVRALGQQSRDWAKDVFSIDVMENSRTEVSKGAVLLAEQHHKTKCNVGEDATMLIVVMDAKFEQLKPKQRVAAIKNLSGFLSLHKDVFQLQPLNNQEDLLEDSVVLAGPGNVKKRTNRHTTSIQWQVGCNGHLWKQHMQLVQQLKQQARDGTLSEVLQQPVVGWHVKTEASSAHRDRRETGSGDYDDEAVDEEEADEAVESETEAVPSVHIVPTMPSPVFPEPTASHPHRHHHGEVETGPGISIMPELVSSVGYRLPTSPVIYGTILPTPVLVPVRPTHLMSSEMLVEPSRVYDEFAEITPSATPVFVSEVEPSVTTDMPTSQVTEPLPSSSSSSSSSSSPSSSPGSSSTGSSGSSIADTTETSPMTEESTPSSTPFLVTDEQSSTERSTTERSSTSRTTEGVVYEPLNFKPKIEQLLAKQVATAGKVFSFVIPEDSFCDVEDGYTRNLRLIFKTSEGTSVSSSSWLQFDPEKQEVYGLPLEEHVSRWTFIVEAMDKEGKSVSDNLELTVQHHKGRRSMNHEFTLQLRVEKKYDFASSVDWQLNVLDGLARLYGDPDSSQIVVRSITEMSSGSVNFTWTNESLPRSTCPKDEINRLFKMLVLNEAGDPSTALNNALFPSVKPKKVTYRGLHQCELVIIGKPQAPSLYPKLVNYPPTIRNPVDHINATVGRLLVYKVPEDTFYDPEDGSTRSLKLSLLTMDRSHIPLTNWLQFDVKNQEFYGIPMQENEGRKEYQLVCEDSGSLTANDGLVVVVHPAPKVQYNVEFVMTLAMPFESFVSSSSMKRKFIEKLTFLFGDNNSSSISLSSLTEGSTVVTWHNRTLPTDHCPEVEIMRLRKLLLNENQTPIARVGAIMGPEFNVKAITVSPIGKCQGELTVWHYPDSPGPPSEDTHPVGSSDEYLVTYVVPAVIIAAMLILAGIVACVLYRRRRTGKMNVGDEDERQSFRNKGIPVIFQDELEERPDPGNKSPVIMKEEKPPLPPPEYQRGEPEHPASPPTAAHPLLGENTASEDPPYQPPPPFTSSRDSGRQNRPKPTPTYRKPPPYVPP